MVIALPVLGGLLIADEVVEMFLPMGFDGMCEGAG